MSTNPLQARLAAIWDTAMGDRNGMAAAAALSQAIIAARVAVPGPRRPGRVQDTALDLLLARGAHPGVAWLTVASNTFGAMLSEVRINREDER